MTGGAATALWLYVVFFAPLSAAEQAPPPGDTLVRAEVKQESVASVAGAMENEYVFPDVGRKIAEHLRSQQRQGAYAAPMTFLQFADALTHDLQAINADRHLYVRYQTDAPDGVPGVMVTRRVRPGAGGSAGPTSEIGPRIQRPISPSEVENHQRRNFYLNRADRLDGNVGYLEVRQFFGQTEAAREAAAAAMTFLSNTDAMIIDVRRAPGGDATMVDILASYFFGPTPVQTLATYFRPADSTVVRTTLADLPGKRRPDIDVFVLTGRGTASAAEDFAFLIQQTGRGKTVGERTAGAGHANALIGIGNGLSVSVSIGRTFNPKTNLGWEGTGVQPDIPAPADRALFAAHRQALANLESRTGDPRRKQEIAWTREALEAAETPVSVAAELLENYAGTYGERVITTDGARLYYQRTAERPSEPLLPISPTVFALGEGQRIEFVRDTAGKITELRMLGAGVAAAGLSRTR